ncbi:MAG: hypothetical protein OXJ52_00505 [Oligoflexia bacterium]|nr:hypothetical protein [Oligoflexia bacterium]
MPILFEFLSQFILFSSRNKTPAKACPRESEGGNLQKNLQDSNQIRITIE